MSELLTARQQKFVAEYVRGHSAAAAARAAGYGKAYSEHAAKNLLPQPKIAAEIEAARTQLQQKTGYDVERAVVEIDNAIALAISVKNPMSIAKLLELKAKLHGLLIDRLDVRHQVVDLSGVLEEARGRNLRAAIEDGTVAVVDGRRYEVFEGKAVRIYDSEPSIFE